jgi:hypothetical protein
MACVQFCAKRPNGPMASWCATCEEAIITQPHPLICLIIPLQHFDKHEDSFNSKFGRDPGGPVIHSPYHEHQAKTRTHRGASPSKRDHKASLTEQGLLANSAGDEEFRNLAVRPRQVEEGAADHHPRKGDTLSCSKHTASLAEQGLLANSAGDEEFRNLAVCPRKVEEGAANFHPRKVLTSCTPSRCFPCAGCLHATAFDTCLSPFESLKVNPLIICNCNCSIPPKIRKHFVPNASSIFKME